MLVVIFPLFPFLFNLVYTPSHNTKNEVISTAKCEFITSYRRLCQGNFSPPSLMTLLQEHLQPTDFPASYHSHIV